MAAELLPPDQGRQLGDLGFPLVRIWHQGASWVVMMNHPDKGPIIADCWKLSDALLTMAAEVEKLEQAKDPHV